MAKILDTSNGDVGTQADSPAASDVGAFSLLAFIKRGLQNWTTLHAKIPAIGPAAKAASMPVSIATDQPNVPTASTPVRGAPISRSGTITAGGATNQVLMAANAARRGWSIQNLSAGDLWINEFGGAPGIAGTDCMQLAAGAYFSTQDSEQTVTAINIFGATTGQAFTAKEW